VREINLIAQGPDSLWRDLTPSSSLAALLLAWRASMISDGFACYIAIPILSATNCSRLFASIEQVVKYIDIPLQHADDGMLRAMKRERSTDALRRLLTRVRKAIPAVALRTSFIVGFPARPKRRLPNLVDFVAKQRFDRMGVFTYSREENTAACELPTRCPNESNGAGGPS